MPNRREFLNTLMRGGILAALGLLSGSLLFRSRDKNSCSSGFDCSSCSRSKSCMLPAAMGARQMVWQLDPARCIQCGRCATNCVMSPSAVKCTHAFAMCGYCDLCGGYFKPGTKTLDTAAEHQLCPTNALKRKFIEDPFFEYTVNEELCIGCGKCVKGCGAFGNGSLQLQVRHDCCKNCNECSIARNCPSQAFTRVPANKPSLLKSFGNAKTAILTGVAALLSTAAMAIQRFPKPEFESAYTQPQTQIPLPRGEFLACLDVIVLFVLLSVVTWLVLKKRSRLWVFAMSVFSLVYFGFYREGCVCSIGAIQNVSLALFDNTFILPLSVVLFFALPLVFTLFFGRTFCAAVCPFGAMQDFFAFKPQALGPRLNTVLGIIPYLYLGLAVLFAATGTDFIICRYDPFVGIFRFNASFSMFLFSGILLLSGVFIARPYCRFLCPYGVLLNWTSRFSRKHLSITPSECIQCRLCENSCPYDAIDIPVTTKSPESRPAMVKKMMILTVLIPFLVLAFGYTGSRLHETLAGVDSRVKLAKEVLAISKSSDLKEKKTGANSNSAVAEESYEIKAYKSSGKTEAQVYEEASMVLKKFYVGGWLFGGFIGLVFGMMTAGRMMPVYRTDYVTNKGRCFSCARCVDYCPVKS
ncbi:MAG: 4Fe-4S binding protein [Bacteroidetes bacterium]|nr:4Fe-4S binding protein [Bacteroidota bacterium]